MRIARALALAGIDSRRKCEIHVQNGAVTVNGEVVRDLGRQVDPQTDGICFRGRPVVPQKFVYYILHKPPGYTTTASDPHAAKTVFRLLPKKLVRGSRQPLNQQTRVFPVGRLDRDSAGLLLFTNDGDMANKLLHPRYEVGKWYEVKLNRAFDLRDRRHLLDGIRLPDGMAKAQKVQPKSRRILRVLIQEGKKREIRRMFEKLEYKVLALMRISFGPLLLGQLNQGSGRFLTKSEVLDLKRVTSSK